jgi:hypothetical protein
MKGLGTKRFDQTIRRAPCIKLATGCTMRAGTNKWVKMKTLHSHMPSENLPWM